MRWAVGRAPDCEELSVFAYKYLAGSLQDLAFLYIYF
jgi:hypothetical protein